MLDVLTPPMSLNVDLAPDLNSIFNFLDEERDKDAFKGDTSQGFPTTDPREAIFFTSNAAKVDGILRALLSSARNDFPKLSKGQWMALSYITANYSWIKFADLIDQKSEPMYQGFLARELVRDADRIGLSRMEMKEIKKLTTGQILSALTAAKVLRRSAIIGDDEFRRRLSEVSGLPPECVYKGDPDPFSLWEISAIRITDTNSAVADFNLRGEYAARMSYELYSKDRHVYGKILHLANPSERKFANQKIENFLFTYACDYVAEAIVTARGS